MVLDAILPVVSRSSNLALRLYQVAAVPQQEAKQLIETAKVTNSFALNLKQVGTLITENDRLPSPEVCYDLKRSLSRHTITQGWDLGPDIVSLCSYHTVVQISRGTCYLDLL